MKRKCHRTGGVLVAALASIAIHAQPPEDDPGFRAWTSLTGHEMRAAFQELRDGRLVVRDEEGNERIIRLELLVPDDRAAAREMDEQRTAGPAAETAGPASDRLPVFLEGSVKGSHAVHSNANFVATVDARGWIEIQCMDGGSAVGQPLMFSFGHGYADRERNRHPPRRIVSFQTHPTPTLEPTRLSYEALLEDNVRSGWHYEFTGNTLQVWGWVEDPPGLRQPTSMRLSFSFRPSHEFHDQTPVAERKDTLAPYTLVVQPVTGRAERFPYGDIVSRFPSPVRSMSIDGPVFGARRVSVEAQSPRTTRLLPWIYRDYAPYQGFSVRLLKDEVSSRSDRERIILTID